MVCVMGMSRGAGAGLEPATGESEGDVEGEVERDSDERSFGRTLGLGEGARGPRDPMLTGALSDDEMFIDGVFASEFLDVVVAADVRDRLS